MARREDDTRTRQRRHEVALEAARLLAEHGGDDVARARAKAAARLGVRDESALPGSQEILEALRGHRELFGKGTPGADLRRLREAALDAMEFFAALEPRLVGAVWDGDGLGDTVIRLHLHADDPDAVARVLLDRGIPARQEARSIRLGRGERGIPVPAWSFDADGIAFEVLQLPLAALRRSPRDALDDRVVERASRSALRRLLDADSADA